MCAGCAGIATGWSTSVPNFNPLDLMNNIRRKLSGLPFLAMEPWYCGFEGTIETVVIDSLQNLAKHFSFQYVHYITKFYFAWQGNNRDGTRCFTIFGKAEKVGENEILISELPVGTWTSK